MDVSYKKGNLQGDLFAEFADEGSNDSKYSNLKSLNDLDFDYQLIDTEEKSIQDIIQEIEEKVIKIKQEGIIDES